MPIHRAIKTLISKTGWYAYNTYRKGVHYHLKLSQAAALLDAPREIIEAFQAKRLEKLFQHAYQTTPYYRELFKTATPDISQIPPLEKQDIREQLGRLCSTAFTAEQRIENATGGSTGTPLTFYQDRNYWNQRNLSVYYFDRWAGWNFGEPQLIIWGAPVDLEDDRHRKHWLSTFWRNQYWLNGFRLTDAAMLAMFEQMNQDLPQTILAYPSSLYQFATFLSDNGLIPKWKLKGIISSAEMLYPHYRALAEIIFKAKVYNRYGGREVGLIGMECAEGRMHINCRDLYLEIDSPDPYAEPGEILITQLNNYAMPFIRYRIGDVGMFSAEPCPCGNDLPVLADLLGRSTATFRTRTGTLIHAGYFTRQFYGVKGVEQFQIIQETLKHCVLKVVVNRLWTEASRRSLVQCIQKALGSDVVVTVKFVDSIPLPASGKREYTISKV
ncbi:phenylacetate--CoA ligase family protein [Candidatus Poribacteria bacterium]|nr:phenylacetate--CoA ligase family protein [Candidatus Poribacteria bacterium]MYK24921.1 phenylacetate--CoA ligase family protein [Candidatus Poribacteria bacterium]